MRKSWAHLLSIKVALAVQREKSALVLNGKGNLEVPKRDFRGGPVVEDLSCNTGDTSSIPGRGTKIPHAAGQFSLCATSAEPATPQRERLSAATTESVPSGAHAPQLESPRATTREKLAHRSKEPTCCNRRSRMPQLRPDAAKK